MASTPVHRTTPRGAGSARGLRVRRGASFAAAAVALAMAIAFGAPAQAGPVAGQTRALLTVQGSTTAVDAAAWVIAHGGSVEAVYDVADALLVSLPAGVSVPGTTSVSDVALHVDSVPAAAVADVKGATYRATLGASDTATGNGVTVALVDTGVADVADLAGRVTHVNVSGDVQGDGLGHGTFMAGLIAGDGASSGGTYAGVAPDARILDVQVAGADGSTSLSTVLAGLQAIADASFTDSSIRVVSLALSTGSPLPPSADPLARALDRLWARGLTVVVAAGNDGPEDGTVTTPGSDPTLITVGAVDEHGTSVRGDDTVADFSARGTVVGGSKPDVVAPGVSLVSTRAVGSVADVENPQARVGSAYFTGSGTSMSEAVTAGAVATLVGVRPALTPDTVKKLLAGSAYTSATLGKDDGAGKGALDLAAALKAAPSIGIVKGNAKSVLKGESAYGPDPADASTWKQFGDAWAAEDLDSVAAAWADLSPQTRRWAATAFALSLVTENAGASDDEFAAIEALAHSWATQAWQDREWATDAFVAHSWSSASFDAHSWAAHSWSAHSWSAHSWAESDWSAHSWSDAQWLAHSWSAHSWSNVAWDAHSWAQADWLTFAWTAHSWAAHSWAATAWADQAWSAHSWSAHSWSAHSWSADAWDAHSWSAHSWSAHSWSAHSWSAHSWSAHSWSDYAWAAHSWAVGAWDAHSWSDIGWSLGDDVSGADAA